MYYFIGIKGSGMASLATILSDLGYQVQGSDIEKHFFTEEGLLQRNIKINKYDESNIKEGLTIVKGASIKEDNIELIKARKLNLEILEYNEMVGKLTDMFKTICICGCHGKTTTTTMLEQGLGSILKMNYLIGDGTGYANKENKFFALESCEYQRHFLKYNPYYTIITNVDLDHVDYYKDLEDIKDAYSEFANKTKRMVIACGDDQNTRDLKINKDIIYYGINDNNDVIAKNILYKDNGTSFDVVINNKLYYHYDLPIYGLHQVLDFLSVVTVSYLENIKGNVLQENLANFTGAKRRFHITKINNNIIIDDYAHHPNEVKATINSVKQKYPDKKIVVIFQPHTFSRTKAFYKDFIEIFKKADYTYLLDIFPARERQEDYPDITSKIICEKLENSDIINISDAKILSKYDNTCFVFMSPNDISKLEDDLKELLKNKE